MFLSEHRHPVVCVLSGAAFRLRPQSRVVVTETVMAHKAEIIFSLVLYKENFADPWSMILA